MKNTLSTNKFFLLCLTFFSISFLTSCDPTVSDLIGKEFAMNDGYHIIKFKSETSYYVYQKPYNCGGDGSWSFNDGKVILGPNDSNCESTRELEDTYDISLFK